MDNVKKTLDIYEIMRQLGFTQEKFEEFEEASKLHPELSVSMDRKINKPVFT